MNFTRKLWNGHAGEINPGKGQTWFGLSVTVEIRWNLLYSDVEGFFEKLPVK